MQMQGPSEADSGWLFAGHREEMDMQDMHLSQTDCVAGKGVTTEIHDAF